MESEDFLKAKTITDIVRLSQKLQCMEEGYMDGMNLACLPLHVLFDLKTSISCLYLAEENAAICYYGDVPKI